MRRDLEFCYAKQKNVPDEFQGTFGYGDVWTWIAIDSDTKLVPSWLVGERTNKDCYFFLKDFNTGLRTACNSRPTASSPMHRHRAPVRPRWVDFAMLVKNYGTLEHRHPRAAPTALPSAPESTFGSWPATPTPRISTSYVERQNLTMRMGMRRFTRLTNAFSKKVENHAHAVSLHFMHYNFAGPT